MPGEFIVPRPPEGSSSTPSEVQAAIEGTFADAIPGWEAQDGSPERALIEGVSIPIAENWQKAAESLQVSARWLASSVFQLDQHDAIPAGAPSTWTLLDDDGHTIEAGTQITVAGLDGSRVGFEVVADVTVAPGSTSTAAGGVALIATEPGAASNNLQADAQLESFVSFVDTVTLTAASSGGVDAEDDPAYLDRFVRFGRRFSDRVVLPEHFVLFALDWDDPTFGSPVERAIAYDGYNPADSTSNNPGMLTLSAIKADGTSIDSGDRTALKAALEAETISGFIVNVVAPTYTSIDVSFTITVYDTFDPTSVLAAAEAAVTSYLSPELWGVPPYLTDTTGWIDEPVIDIGTLEGVIKNTDGVRRATVVQLEGGSVDVTLTGKPGLPTPGTITGTLA